jgi:hypothetical protein
MGAVYSDADPLPGRAGLPDTWWIGLSSWVLQDGNYTDFVAGERRQFALELGYSRAERLRTPADEARRCRYSGRDVSYDVTGQLVRAASEPMVDAFVLDFGLGAYTEWMVLDDLEPPKAGDWLTGRISLSVDHFAYMDYLGQRPGMPPLIHTWTIHEIQLDTTPGIPVEPGDPRYSGPGEGPRLVRDDTRESWQPVAETRMWDHDGGYRLRCSLEGAEPAHSMARSGSSSPYGPLPGH